MADRFPGPYLDNVPKDVDNPGKPIERVKFTYTELGSRPTVLRQVKAKNSMTIEHTGGSTSGRQATGGRG